MKVTPPSVSPLLVHFGDPYKDRHVSLISWACLPPFPTAYRMVLSTHEDRRVSLISWACLPSFPTAYRRVVKLSNVGLGDGMLTSAAPLYGDIEILSYKLSLDTCGLLFFERVLD